MLPLQLAAYGLVLHAAFCSTSLIGLKSEGCVLIRKLGGVVAEFR
jgi:hypothetical protein